MPTSHPLLLTPVATEILGLQPSSILDLGVGNGKWGVLAREYTDIWYRHPYNKTKIDGIEIFPNYRNPNWKNYNQIFIGNIRNILPTLDRYDLILFLEVLEHIEKNEALELLNQCLDKCKTLIFSYTNSLQGPAFGNDNECHISTWSDEDFNFKHQLIASSYETFVYKAWK